MRTALMCLLMFLCFWRFAAAAEQEQMTEPQSATGPSVDIEIGKGIPSLTGDTILYVFEWNFETWEPDRLHWIAPSTWHINGNGDWYLYAKRVANFRNHCILIKCGVRRMFKVNVTYFNGWDGVKKRCVGSVVHSTDYVLAQVSFGGEEHNPTMASRDSQFAKVRNNVRCGRATRFISR